MDARAKGSSAIVPETMEEVGEALRRAELRLAEIERIARVGTWEWEAETGAVTWSDSLHGIAGVPDGFEPSWEAFFSVVHPDDRARVERAFQRSLTVGSDYTVMHRFLTDQGEERLVICRAAIERDEDGAAVRVIGATLDLTDLQRSAERHRAHHEQLRAAEELTGLGSFEWDVRRNRVSWSDNLYRIFGHEPGDFEGTFEAYLEFVHPDDRAERRASIMRLLEGGETSDDRHRIVRPNGEVRTLESAIRVVRDGDGEPVRLIGACRDLGRPG